MNAVYTSKHVSLETKIRTFQVFSASIFLYISELCTLAITKEGQLDAFDRKLIRRAMGIHWPKTITNNDLYQKTKTEPWSKTIKRRRLNWLGHVLRMDENTPALQQGEH